MEKTITIEIKPSSSYDIQIIEFIRIICGLGKYTNKDIKKYKGKAYPYIPSGFGDILSVLSIIDHLYPKKLAIKVADLGAGTGGFITCLSKIDTRIYPTGFELNPIENIQFCNIIKQDILTIGGKKLAEFDILYAYNPFTDDNLMFKALKHWMTVKPKDCVIIYNRTSYFNEEQTKWFERNFDKINQYSKIFISKTPTLEL